MPPLGGKRRSLKVLLFKTLPGSTDPPPGPIGAGRPCQVASAVAACGHLYSQIPTLLPRTGRNTLGGRKSAGRAALRQAGEVDGDGGSPTGQRRCPPPRPCGRRAKLPATAALRTSSRPPAGLSVRRQWTAQLGDAGRGAGLPQFTSAEPQLDRLKAGPRKAARQVRCA
jgi:hypothetical protein